MVSIFFKIPFCFLIIFIFALNSLIRFIITILKSLSANYIISVMLNLFWFFCYFFSYLWVTFFCFFTYLVIFIVCWTLWVYSVAHLNFFIFLEFQGLFCQVVNFFVSLINSFKAYFQALSGWSRVFFTLGIDWLYS